MKQLIIISILNLVVAFNSTGQKPLLNLEPYIFENSKGEKVDAELGSFQVPENRINPNSKTLNLKFVRFKSTSLNPGHPIVYLAGGPGGSGIATAQGSRFELFMKMREIGDVIAFDQRGTGMSDGLPNYPGFYILDIDKPLTKENAQNTVAEEALKMETFFKSEGHDLSGYNSNQSADDLNDLRLALGAEKINIWAISYGTHLALTTLKRHEAKVHKMILAGVEGYDDTVKLPSDQQELLEEIDAILKNDPKTKSIFPDFLGDVEKLLSKVDEDPVATWAKNPMSGDSVQVVLGKMDLQILFSWYLGGPENFKSLPLDVKNMLAGDYSANKDFYFYLKAGQLRGMSLGMDLASGISINKRKRIEKEAQETLLGDAINFPFFIQYDALKHLDLGSDFRTPFKSSVPVFCISGTLDGRTAVKNADFALKTLENGQHLIIEGAGHSDPLFLSSPKIAEYMIDFMNDKEIGNPRIVLPPVEFELPAK